MAAPGLPGSQVPAGEDWLVRRVADLERAVRELAAANQLATAGITTTPTGIAISGTLSLPAGIIDNASLASPVTAAYATTATATAWNVTTTQATMASTSITVPAGFSSAFVVAWSSVHFQDSAPNSFYTRAVIAASNGSEMGGLANTNMSGVAMHATSLTGLSGGGTISLASQVRAGFASTVTAGRIAQVGGFGIFFR